MKHGGRELAKVKFVNEHVINRTTMTQMLYRYKFSSLKWNTESIIRTCMINKQCENQKLPPSNQTIFLHKVIDNIFLVFKYYVPERLPFLPIAGLYLFNADKFLVDIKTHKQMVEIYIIDY